MLRKAFERYVTLSDSEWEDASARFKTLHFKKDTQIVSEGEIDPYFYFVISGVHRLYYLTPDGEEITLGFSFDNNFSGAYESFITQTPSKVFFHTITDTKVLAIGFEDMTYLFDTYKNFERWGRLFMQQILFGRLQRDIELTTLSAEERYTIFANRIPAELLTIPLKYLASYLDMTPETLSRVRAKR
jgi:CRP-like cAMP-binding protein